jgi:tetratricopeptide (TPR) repeat protein
MKARTAQRLAILIAVLSLVGGTGFFTQRYQVDRLARKQLEKADLAVKEGDLAKAVTLFKEHLRVFDDDREIKIKYADTLLKVSRSLPAQSEAFRIYQIDLAQAGGHEDVRRSLIKLKFEMGRFISKDGREDGADVDLKILLKMPENKNDPHLLYLMGQCYEQGGDDVTAIEAVKSYRKVVAMNDATDRVGAGERLATLLHDRLKQPKEAKEVINQLVVAAPKDYRGYLARGRFWLGLAARDQSGKSLKSDATKDFEKGRDLRLMSSVKNVSGIPAAGKDLIIVAAVDKMLHFRVFDGDGKSVVDTDEKRLTEQARQIADLKKQLVVLWPPHELTGSERALVISAVTSIVNLEKAREDFEMARKLAPREPEVYLQQASAAMYKEKSGYDDARRILKDGLENIPTGCDLRLMSSLNDQSDIPKEGKNLIVVAVAAKNLHIRIFNSEGKEVVDADEKKLTAKTQRVAELRNRLKGLEPPHELTDKDKSQVINAVRSIVDYVPPTLTAIYDALAQLESRAGNKDEAIEVLKLILKSQPDQSELRVRLAELLANRGDTGQLLLQIEELKRLGQSPLLIQYFTAFYHINANQFLKAKQILVALQAAMKRATGRSMLASIKMLLARCYEELGEPEMQQNAYVQALSANPEDLTAKLRWANSLRSQGDIAGAIKEYRTLVKQEPRVRPVLARLLIGQNQRRPVSQRNWSEVTELINQMAETEPESVEPVVLKADLLFAQGDQAAARDELEKAQQVRFPKSIEIRIALAKLLGIQERVDEALSVLDQAKQKLGDHVDLRLASARLWASKKGPKVREVLMELSQDVEKFTKVERKRLLEGLALELREQQDFDGASRVWTQLAVEDPSNIVLRFKLLDLALGSTNKDDIEKSVKEIEKNIKQIEEIEGKDGILGRYGQVKYLIWQAERAEDSDTRLAIQLKAHMLLDDLVSRRGDWSLIPLVSAELAQQELYRGNLKEDEKRAKEESIIGFYLQAIKLGQRRPDVVRKTVELLFKNGRGNEALVLLSSIPVESQLGRDVGYHAVKFALDNRDFVHAEQIARKAVEAKPDDFQERLWLVHTLLAGEHEAEAEKELREAVFLAPDDPDRWNALVSFMIITKQPAKAATVIQEAEVKLPPQRAPMALAWACEKMGEAYSGSGNDAEMKKWNDAARAWYEKARAAQPADLSINRRLAEFFLRSRQIDEAKKCLEVIRDQGGGVKNAETAAWANRTLAWVLANGADRTQLSKALALFEPDGKPVPEGQEGRNLSDPEDLRVLARVLEAQKTLVHRKRAIVILETLTETSLANPEDRFLLAHLYEAIDDWPKALVEYRELKLRTTISRDVETFNNRRAIYLAKFADSLLRHCKRDDKEGLTEAQTIVDELKQLQPKVPGALVPLALQVQIHQIRNEDDQVVKLIQAFVDRPNLGPQALGTLAGLAEKMKQIALAEKLYRQQESLAGTLRNKLALATFLGRHDHVDEGLSICEPLWKTVPEVELLTVTSINILFGSDDNAHASEPAQIERVAGWIQLALEQAKKQRRPTQLLLLGLGNVREWQGKYVEAENWYQLATQQDDRDGISINNLAWLAALKDKKFKEALNYANRALTLKPDQPDFLDTRGMIYLLDGQPKLGLDDLQRAVEIDPSSPSKLFHLTQAYLANADKEKAKQSLRAARDKGFTPGGLHVLERQNYDSVLKELEAP